MKIKYLTLSDVHLGAKRNSTENIIANLDKYFDDYKDNSRFTDLDAIFIVGDLFDTALDYFDPDVARINIWFIKLSAFCSRHDIVLRILNGTPSHDWKQGKNLQPVADALKHKVNFKYIEDLSIEYIPELGINVLYVPDEWNSSNDETFRQVQILLKEQNLKQVDITMIHGTFRFQLPICKGEIHKEENYLDITKYFVSVGHIHTYAVYDRIIGQGSFDRLAHGEEEPKGAVVISIDDENGHKFNFIENKQAKIFKTIKVKSNNLDAVLEQIDKQISKLPIYSHVRIKAKKDHQIFKAFETIKSRYILYVISKLTDDEEEEIKTLASLDLPSYQTVTITKENIVDLLINEILIDNVLSDQQMFKLRNKLEEAVG